MITLFKVALALLSAARSLFGWLERRNAISEGKKIIINEELKKTATAANIRIKEESKVEGMTDAQVDDGLNSDFRP